MDIFRNKLSLLFWKLSVEHLQQKIKGIFFIYQRFLISGWPKTKEALTFLQERFINPHIIFVFDLSEEEAELKFSEIDARNHV